MSPRAGRGRRCRGSRKMQVTVESTDEIGQLAATFNRMADKIASSHASLEERVDQRTSELQQEVAERTLAERQLAQHALKFELLHQTAVWLPRQRALKKPCNAV